MQIRSRLTLSVYHPRDGDCIALVLLRVLPLSNHTEREFDKDFRERRPLAVLLIKVDQIDSALLTVIDRAKADNLYRENIVVLDSLDRMLYVNTANFELKVDTAIFSRVRASAKFVSDRRLQRDRIHVSRQGQLRW